MFQRLLEQIALGLEDCGIPYMVIGGQAVLLYGEPRLTRDIDIALGTGPDKLADILVLVGRWGWRVAVDAPEEFVRKTLVLPCLEPESGLRVDFIFSCSAYEQQAIERVRRVPVGRAQVCFTSVEDLIIHKVIAGRPRDLEDVRNVILKNPKIDPEYVRRWLKEFDASLGKPLTKQFEELSNASRRH